MESRCEAAFRKQLGLPLQKSWRAVATVRLWQPQPAGCACGVAASATHGFRLPGQRLQQRPPPALLLICSQAPERAPLQLAGGLPPPAPTGSLGNVKHVRLQRVMTQLWNMVTVLTATIEQQHKD